MASLKRQERVNVLLRNLISSFIKLENFSGVIVTVSNVKVSKDIRTAQIFISVFPEEKEKEILKALKEKSRPLYNYLKSHLKMKFLPLVSFAIDKSLKAERRIEEILDGHVAK